MVDGEWWFANLVCTLNHPGKHCADFLPTLITPGKFGRVQIFTLQCVIEP
jgi:hypothetical protein